ncbi:MAG: copper resistance protein CopC/CopD [Actinomycetota bacterium]|nr:copper resistance protein CopC/CopD [Actinomycetota bacterium]
MGRRTRPALLALFLTLLLGLGGPAWAHAFLVRTDPAQGARLQTAPQAVAFQFSEPAILETARVAVRKASGAELEAGPLRAELEGRVLRLSLPPLEDGIYLVAWHVVSARDAHESAGEFAFAVGEVEGAVPISRAAGPLSYSLAVAGWLFFLGFSLAGGALLAGQFLQREDVGLPQPLGLRPALLLALVAATVSFLVSWREAAFSPAGWLGGLAVILMAMASLAVPLSRRGWLPLALLAAGGVAWSARGHVAAEGGAWGTLIDFVHLAAAAAWIGLLAQMVLALWRARRSTPTAFGFALRAYSRLAAVLVGVVVAAGLVSAVVVLEAPSDLWRSGYGRLLVTKGAMVALALALALAGRRRALPRADLGLLRRITSAEVGALAAVLAASALLGATAPPASASAEALLGPSPIEGPASRAAGLAGALTIGVAAGQGELHLEALSPSGGIEGTELDVSARFPDGTLADLHPRPCGAGCFAQQLELAEGVTSLSITAAAPAWEGGILEVALPWPPPPEASALLEEMLTTMRRVERLELHEVVKSGPKAVGRATAQLTGDRFLEEEVYAGGGASDVRFLPGEERAFRLYLPGSRMWYVFWLDDRGRIARERIVSPGHEIEREFSYPG